MDPNRLKPIIVEAVRKQGYVITIEDKMGWTIYPVVGLSIKHMTLGVENQVPILDMRSVNISTEFGRLLKGTENIQADIRVQNFRIMRMHATNGFARLNWQNHILTIHPISAAVYEGTLTGIMHGFELTTAPKWDWALQFKNIQMSQLFQDINPESRIKVSGLADFTLNSKSSGRGVDQVFANLRSTNQFSIRDGVLEGVDLNFLLESADALLNKHPLTAVNTNRTQFDSISGTGAVNYGVANVYVIVASHAFTGQATGSVNFTDKNVNMNLKLKSQKTLETQWEIPILITGTIQDPEFRLDVEEIQKQIGQAQIDRVKDVVKDKIDKVKDQIKDHLPKNSGDFLQNLFGH